MHRGAWGDRRELELRKGIGEGLLGVQEDLGLRVLGCIEEIGGLIRLPLRSGLSEPPFSWPLGSSPPAPGRTDPPLCGRSPRGGRHSSGGGGGFFGIPAVGKSRERGRAGGAVPGLRAAPSTPMNYRQSAEKEEKGWKEAEMEGSG